MLYVFGDRPILEQVDKETDSAYAIRIEDWESANHQIIIWFRNTSISSIVDEFDNIDIANEVWDLLVTWYAGPSGARNFNLTHKLYQIRQEPGKRITVYHSRLKSIWDQLIAFEPVLSNSADTKLVYVHREQGRPFQFLMGLRDEFELARSHSLHQNPLPTVSQAIHKLVNNETRLQTKPNSIQTMVLTTPAIVSQTVSSADGYYLIQAKYTSDLISRASITDSKIVDTPIEYNCRLNSHDGESLSDDTLYRRLVESLIYLTVTPVFPSVNSPTFLSKGKGNNVRRHNNKKSLRICSFCKNKGHSIETCYTR